MKSNTWTDFYDSSISHEEIPNRYLYLEKKENANFFLNHCSFSELKSRAIYISYKDCPIVLAETSCFIGCSSSDNEQGGSIFFVGHSIIFNKCCFVDSNIYGTNKDGILAYLFCKNDENSLNYFLFSVVFGNGLKTQNGLSQIHQLYGLPYHESMNITQNFCNSYSIFKIEGSGDCWINNSLIVNNKDSGTGIMLNQPTEFYADQLEANENQKSGEGTALITSMKEILVFESVIFYDSTHEVGIHCLNCGFLLSYSEVYTNIIGENCSFDFRSSCFSIHGVIRFNNIRTENYIINCGQNIILNFTLYDKSICFYLDPSSNIHITPTSESLPNRKESTYEKKSNLVRYIPFLGVYSNY